MARSGDLRARMEALNRGPLAEQSVSAPASSMPGEARGLGLASLELVARGQEVSSSSGRSAYLVETAADVLHTGATGVQRSFADAFSVRHEHSSPRTIYDESVPEDLIFLDIETTGLSPTGPVFLVGLMVWEGVALVVRQYFARDETEERAILELGADGLASRNVLVSFNGVQFDVRYLRARAARLGVALTVPRRHVDLLHEARRVWRGRVPNCRLQTLEDVICGRRRIDDLTGRLIPEAYRRFVRTSDATQIAGILKHNALDLFTLADLLTRLSE